MREFHVASNITTLTHEQHRRLRLRQRRSPARTTSRCGGDVGGQWPDVTDREFADEVTARGEGPHRRGIQPGDRVAVMSKTRYEWTVADFALFAVGAVVVPIYETSSAEQVEWILSDSGARAAFVETDDHVGIVESVRERTPELVHLWQFDKGAIDGLVADGKDVSDEEITKRRQAVTLDDHGVDHLHLGHHRPPEGLPVAAPLLRDRVHRDRRGAAVVLQREHVHAAVPADRARLRPGHRDRRDLRRLHARPQPPTSRTCSTTSRGFRPTFVLAVPRVFEKVYNTREAEGARRRQGQDLRPVRGTSRSPTPRRSTGVRSRCCSSSSTCCSTSSSTSKLRAALGGQCISAVSGGAPLGARLGHFFRGVGVTIYEGYGLTETTAGICRQPAGLDQGRHGRPAGRRRDRAHRRRR